MHGRLQAGVHFANSGKVASEDQLSSWAACVGLLMYGLLMYGWRSKAVQGPYPRQPKATVSALFTACMSSEGHVTVSRIPSEPASLAAKAK